MYMYTHIHTRTRTHTHTHIGKLHVHNKSFCWRVTSGRGKWNRFLPVPTEFRKIVEIQDYKKLAREKVCVKGGHDPNQAQAGPVPHQGISRDPAAMEETCAKSNPYSFEI